MTPTDQPSREGERAWGYICDPSNGSDDLTPIHRPPTWPSFGELLVPASTLQAAEAERDELKEQLDEATDLVHGWGAASEARAQAAEAREDALRESGDRLQSAASRLAEWVREQDAPYEVAMAAIEAKSAVDDWTEARTREGTDD